MRNLLITGGTTFVSKFAAEYFVHQGNTVTVLNRGSRKQPEGVKWLPRDWLNIGNALKGTHFDAILDITAYHEEHIRSLLQSVVSFNDYIMISSSAVYPETNPQPFSENQCCGRNTVWGDYGWNKLQAEKTLQAFFPDAYILRPPYFYGRYYNLYREAFVFDCALQDRPFFLPGDGSMPLQFFHVSDLCRLIEILLEQHPDEHVFNTGNPETVSIKDWVTLCYRAAGKQPEFVSVDPSVPQREYFCFYDYAYVLDVSRQQKWMPDTLPLFQGLQEELEWYRQHPEGVDRRKPYMTYIDQFLR